MYEALRPSRSEFVPVRGQRYHVRLWGSADGPEAPLVLLHGWMDVAASYQFMVDALPGDFLAQRLVVAPDWRGFGQTTGPACDHYAFADYLGDLDALLDHYAPHRAVDLIGHSMGGHVVMVYAGVRPTRVRRLVNLEGFGVPDANPTDAPHRYARWLDDIRALAAGQRRLRNYADAHAVAKRLMQTNHRLAPAKALWLAHRWAAPQTQPDGSTRWEIQGAAAHRVVSARLSPVSEVLALYAAITASVLVVEASDNSMARWWKDRYDLAEFHRRLQSVPDIEVQTLPDCGHMLHHDQPQRLASLITAFLQTAATGTHPRT